MTKIMELRPDKNLLNSRFEKYQFTAETLPITSEISLKHDVYRLELNGNQDSLLEARLFAFHNHLFKNPYDGSCWFIDESWIVWKFDENGSLENMCTLHNTETQLPNFLYNPSMGFASKNIVIISDGGNCLKLITVDNEKGTTISDLTEAVPGIILDVRYVETMSKLIIAICAIKSQHDKKYTSLTLLSYLSKNPGDTLQSFELKHVEALKIQGALEYAHIEENGNHLHCICQDSIKFENAKSKALDANATNSNKDVELKIPKYCWSQDEDSLTVWITVEKEDRNKIEINVTSTELSVILNNNILMQGQCQHRLDEKLATWKYENDTLKLELVKYETGLMWSELIKGDTGGECLPNETLAAEIHTRLAHLCTDQSDAKIEGQPCIGFNTEQLEECDLEGKDNILQRINLDTQETTHLAMLSVSNHVLFTYKIKSGYTICLRHDHDGCVWITDHNDNDVWEMKHVCTFPGFGYVEASKTNKKFCVSPANDLYVAILEHTRHIFLYEKPKLDDVVSKQWIVDLGAESSPIMGAAATNKHLIVLTKHKLYRLEIFP